MRRLKISHLLLISTIILSSNLHSQAKKSRPNVILIMADDMGYGDISCYGNMEISTPNLDKMAKEGVKFIDFHTNGAVCSPTRAALLTGKYQQRTGISGVVTAARHRDVGLALEEETIADVMRANGYRTGIFGKWHVGYPAKFNPIHNGFDEYIGFVSGNVDYHSHVDQEGYEDWWRQDVLKKESGYSTDIITEHAVNFIKDNSDRDFFLYVPHEAPHYPLQGRNTPALRSIGDSKDFIKQNLTKEESQAIYKEMIEVMDEGIGQLFSTIKELGIAEKTLIIFCSDNGGAAYANNGPLKGTKGTVWEGGHRVPAIAWWPNKIEEGRVSDNVIMTMDLLPTIAKITGTKAPKDIDGIDISKHLLNGSKIKRRDLFWEHGNNRAVRSGDWKLVLPNGAERPQLYNLKEDIGETKDLSEIYPDITSELLEELNSWYLEVSEGVDKLS